MNKMLVTKIILGPPGTGKTTWLVNKIGEHISAGIDPQNICCVTFTRKAASETRSRIQKEFKLPESKLQFFRTLHSLAFHFHGIETSQVMGWSDYIHICKLLGLTISSMKLEADGFLNYHTKGDRLFFLENLARTTKKELNEVWRDYPNDDIDIRELELLATTLKQYKEVQHKLDFTDMILQFNKKKLSPELDILLVDEAQDLAPIQWDMVEILKRTVRLMYIAGDDDQAIYSWAGADVKQFQQQEGVTEVLKQSYRVPKLIHQLAEKVVSKIQTRALKEYMPREEPGEIEYVNDPTHIDMQQGTGSWLLLARNVYLLAEFDRHCVDKGYYFESRYGSAIDLDIGLAIKHWEALRLGQKCPAAMAKIIYKYMSTKKMVVWGSKKMLEDVPDNQEVDQFTLATKYGLIATENWLTSLDLIPPKDKTYFRALLARGENIREEPRIKINTIHGVKGGEADNVVISTDMARRTFEEFTRHADDELRVWYVAITRTKKKLYIIHPRTQYFINFGR